MTITMQHISWLVGELKGHSHIKWQTGEIKEVGEYIVILLDGTVSLDYYARPCYDSKLKTMNYTKDSIIAWCKVSDIKPYKE